MKKFLIMTKKAIIFLLLAAIISWGTAFLTYVFLLQYSNIENLRALDISESDFLANLSSNAFVAFILSYIIVKQFIFKKEQKKLLRIFLSVVVYIVILCCVFAIL